MAAPSKKVIVDKFDETFFDEEFYRSTKIGPTGMGLKGAKRDGNSPFYVEYAIKVTRAFKDTDCKTLLDIGGGMGYRSENHESEGRDTYTCDVSKWAHENSIRPKDKHFCLDVRKVASLKRKFDIVNVERILEYVPDVDAFSCLRQINEVAGKYIILAIICLDHADEGIIARASPGRVNIRPKAYWETFFRKLPWKLDQEKTDIMLTGGWDCCWIFEKV